VGGWREAEKKEIVECNLDCHLDEKEEAKNE
jgi:hypothetical protein